MRGHSHGHGPAAAPVTVRVVLRHQPAQRLLRLAASWRAHKGGGQRRQEELQQGAQLAGLGGGEEVEDGGAGRAWSACMAGEGTRGVRG